MTDLPAWERQLQQNLAGIRRSGENLAKSVASITGYAEVRGVVIEVSANGDITSGW
jgi:hypothetical protein